MIVLLLTVSLGLFVGLALGTLGGGGSTLAVPVLVFVAGLEAQDATTASLIVVGLAAGIGVFGHIRNGNVRVGAGLALRWSRGPWLANWHTAESDIARESAADFLFCVDPRRCSADVSKRAHHR